MRLLLLIFGSNRIELNESNWTEWDGKGRRQCCVDCQLGYWTGLNVVIQLGRGRMFHYCPTTISPNPLIAQDTGSSTETNRRVWAQRNGLMTLISINILRIEIHQASQARTICFDQVSPNNEMVKVNFFLPGENQLKFREFSSTFCGTSLCK